ncbi:MAG: carbohydrate porin [Gammaproteobacteria bacterium]|nr:carbohydrate porin [Gammaproteobacteria bacterium]
MRWRPFLAPAWGLAAALVGLTTLAASCKAVASPPELRRRLPPLSAEYLPWRGRLTQALTWAGHVDAETATGLRGGLERETTAELVAHAGFELDTTRAGWWEGGRFRFDLLGVSSGDPSGDVVGDVQGVSNLAAPSQFRLYALSYRQQFTHALHLRVGLMDLNNDFVVTRVASTLVNSSFGILPTLSANVPTPIYPATGLGGIAGVDGKWLSARAAVFQGDPGRLGALFNQGHLAIGEAEFHSARARNTPASTKLTLGLWHYASASAAVASTGGYYAIAQHRWLLAGGRQLGAFVQFGENTRTTDTVPRYLGLGLRLVRPFQSRPNDLASVGIARAWVHGARAETSYEVTYAAQLGPRIYLQPDLQYVVHPSGVYPNALVGILRIHFEFF